MPYFRSILDPGNWVDVVPNTILFSGITPDDIIRITTNRSLPAPLVPVFLHEYSHHWCFHSLVGNALSVLYLRATSRALGDDPDADHATARDLLKFDIAIEFLRPLIEGLALFAEFDLLPGETASIPYNLHLTAQLFSQHYAEGTPRGESDGSVRRFPHLHPLYVPKHPEEGAPARAEPRLR